MDNYKVVNQKGNEATESQIFEYIAYTMMAQSIEQLKEKGKVTIMGEEFTITPEAIIKLDGMTKHIADRWDTPIEAVKVVKKKAALEWEF